MAVKVVLNQKGIRHILRSQEVQKDMERRARAMAQAAGGDGFEVSSVKGRTRARASVITADEDAKMAEAVDRKLSRSIDAGR